MICVASSEGFVFVVDTSMARLLLRCGFRLATEKECTLAMKRAQGREDSIKYMADVLWERPIVDPIPDKMKTQPFPKEAAPEGMKWLKVHGHIVGMTEQRTGVQIPWQDRQWYQHYILVPEDIVSFARNWFLIEGEGVDMDGNKISI